MKSIDKSGGVWYSNNMKDKIITLVVPPGATPGWVRAQRDEMILRMADEFDVPFTIEKQWVEKGGFRWMVIRGKEYKVGKHAKTTT